MNAMEPVVSIVIPVYNEEKRIINTLNTITSFFAASPEAYEIITVNDGSSDDSQKILNDFASVHPQIKVVSYPHNQGKGYAVKQGVAAASGSLILFSDADMSTPIAEYVRLRKIMEQGSFDIVIGSRSVSTSEVKINQPFYREFMGKTFNRIIKTLLIGEFNDTQCGFKLFKAAVAKELFAQLQLKHFAFDVEVIYRAHHKGYKIKEEGVQWLNSKGSRVSPLKDSAIMFFDLLRLRFFLK
jgi:dolichyl-phosphate beta-glucosyltransferase